MDNLSILIDTFESIDKMFNSAPQIHYSQVHIALEFIEVIYFMLSPHLRIT